jgi:DNA-binding transcriptional ArsR family regulator
MHTLPVEPVEDPARAELLLHPLRQEVLKEAGEASTAAEIARRLGLPAQKVNYHVRTLAEAGFLEAVAEGRKRNLLEKRYRASARSYVLLPQVLGGMSAGADERPPTEADRFSAAYLMSLSARLQRELAVWLVADEADQRRVPTLSLEAELRFTSAEQRAAFGEALQAAVVEVVRAHTAPARDEKGGSRPGRPYRLVLGCYPIPDPPASPVGGGEETQA